MRARIFLLSAAALTILALPAANARPAGEMPVAVPKTSIPLPGAAGAGRDGAPVRLAQSFDPRVTQLEEIVRQLNGRIEELNFQILQMQEQIRKQQEDNEFRLQQLEEKSSSAGPEDRKQAAADETAPADANGTGGDVAASDDGSAKLGAPPRDLGTLIFDPKGIITGAGIGKPLDLVNGTETDDTVVAALPRTDDPDELYRNAYQFILSGDYATAEAGFREFTERFPDSEHNADAHFWLGESLLGLKRYQDAAEIYLKASKAYPNARKAPDTLLKLGVSLAAINQRDVACATFGAIAKRYPSISSALKERIAHEQATAGC